MKKSRLLGAVCAFVFFVCLSSQGYASIVTNSGSQAGGIVTFVNGGDGFTELNIEFTSMTPIIVNFTEGAGLEIDTVTINNLLNSTSTPWTGISFLTIDSWVQSPIGISPVTGSISNILFDNGPTFDPGATALVSISLDPAETVGFTSGSGDIKVIPNSNYSLLITPTAVPIPAAMWLFGSGLLGLVGMARRKKA